MRSGDGTRSGRAPGMYGHLKRKAARDANHVHVHHAPNPIERPHVSGTLLRLEGEDRTGAARCFLHHP